MDLDKQKLLYTRYPMLFGGREFFFECGDGWFDLIDGLCAQLAEMLAKDPVQERRLAPVGTIKEKYAELTVYMDCPMTDEMRTLIRGAALRSLQICDVCGESGRLCSDSHWHRTRCDAHEYTRK